MTSWPRSSLLVTVASERLISSLGFARAISRNHMLQQLGLISKSRLSMLATGVTNYKFGILPAKKDLRISLKLTIKGLQALS